MSDDGGTGGRRYTDEDVRRILSTAVELQERSAALAVEAGRGLTLDELRSVAREAGIDARFVDLAAGHLDAPVERRENGLAGGPTQWHYRASIPGEIGEKDLERILQAIRATLHEKGEVSEVWGRIEWSHSEVGSTIVGLASRDGSTDIDVTATKSEEAALIHGLAVPFGGIFGAAMMKGIVGFTGAQALPFIGLMALVSYGGAWLGWRMRSRWWERRLQRLMDRLTSTVQDVARLPSPDPGGEDPA